MKPHFLFVLLISSTTMLGIVGCNNKKSDPVAVTGTKFYEQQDCSVMTAPEAVAFFNDKSLECGLVTVPADWSKPEGKTIKVAVYRLPATANNPAPAPVAYLAGGPGESAVVSVNDFATGVASYLRERSDVVMIDQRGTGYSQPGLFCPEELGSDATSTVAIKACRNRLLGEGIDLANYTSKYNAWDIDAVRKALGYDEWNLYGSSYGTRLALTVMREKPEGIKSVVLDSVFPPQISGLSEASYTLYWAIEQIASNCANDNNCNTQITDVKGLIETGVERLAAASIGGLDAIDYVTFLAENITEPELLQGIQVIASGTNEDVLGLINNLSDNGNDGGDDIDLSLVPARLYPLFAGSTGMEKSVVCSEEFPFLDSKAGPDLSSSFSLTTQEVINDASAEFFDASICSVWEVPAADNIEVQPVTSNIPTLILAGTADNATPPEWGKIAGQTLFNSHYVEFEGLTHGLLGSHQCVNTITADFLDNPFGTVDSSCTANLPRVEYTFE